MHTAALRERIGTRGEADLGSFTSEELVAVGADSPLEGLLVSERLAAMGPIPLNAALGSALRSLVARGLVDPEAISSGSDLGPLPLRGDLALVVELRRRPQLLALVTSPRPAELAALSLSIPPKIEIVLSGFAERGERPLFLEERRSLLGIHHFAVRNLRRQAAALVQWLGEQADPPSASFDALPGGQRFWSESQFATIELRRPEPDRSENAAASAPRRLRLTIGPGPGRGALHAERPVDSERPVHAERPVDSDDERSGELPGQAPTASGTGAETTATLELDGLVASLAGALRQAWRELALQADALPAR